MTYIKDLTRGWHSAIINHAQEASYPYVIFGIFGVISYPIFYLIWIYFNSVGYENLILRIIVVFLCIPLICANHWPKKLKPFLPYYWYITLLYCLPFLFTYLLLMNKMSYVWTLNCMTVVVLSILLLDLVPLIIILTIGIFLGYLSFKWNMPSTVVKLPSEMIITYSSVLIFGALFAQNKADKGREKLATMKSLGATVAHELRTPLTSIQFGISGAKEYFPVLVRGFTIAQENALLTEKIKAKHLKILSEVFDSIESELKYSNTIINMILMNVRQNYIPTADFALLSMNSCIEDALNRYPFKKGERELIKWERKDFSFLGDNTLMVHVLFNLIKNSLYYIEKARKGQIYIFCSSDRHNNILHIKDTGEGIHPSIMPKLFEKFYTTTLHGTGLGLAFCKLVITGFGGTISCKSKYKHYTQFNMSFPKKEKTKNS